MWAALIVLAAMALGTQALWRGLPAQPGSDFVQLWGVAKAQRSSGYRLGAPYGNIDGYQQQLWQMTRDSGDRRQVFALANWHPIVPNGTPLLYYLMGNLPTPYTATLQWYRAAGLGIFLLTAYVLIRPLRWHTAAALIFTVLLAAAFTPLLFDLALGNLNCMQLLGLMLTAALLRQSRAKPGGLGAAASFLLAGLLALLSLAKPNFNSATLLLGVCLLLNGGWRERFAVIAAWGIISLLLLALPCMLFGRWDAWQQWWTYTFATGQGIHLPPPENFSGMNLLRSSLGLPAAAAFAVVGILLALPLLGPGLTSPSPFTAWRRQAAALRDHLKDPYFCLAGGILLTLALSPLVWRHYLVLAVVPALWLIARVESGALPRAAGWLSLLLFADLPMILNTATDAVPYWLIVAVHGFAWMPAWYGIIVAANGHRHAAAPTAALRPA